MYYQYFKQWKGLIKYYMTHCRASGGMAIFLGVSAAPKRILLSKISYAPVQHSLSQPESFIVTHHGRSYPPPAQPEGWTVLLPF